VKTSVMETATRQTPDPPTLPVEGGESKEMRFADPREWQAERLRVLWSCRKQFLRAAGIVLMISTIVAYSIPSQYTSTTELMPPDSQSSGSGMAMMAALVSKAGTGLGSMAGDLLGMKSTGGLFIGVLRSQTAQERLVQQFDLKKVYGKRLVVDARTKLDDNTAITEDRKSGIITLRVTDRKPQRAAALASAYVDQLNLLVVELSTSAAHRQRVFLGERLKLVKQDLDEASEQLAQFSSKNNTLDIRDEGRAMLDAAANLAGQMIAAQSQLEGLRQIYTDNNPRVRSLNAHVAELRKQLEMLGGTKGKSVASGHQPAEQLSDMPYPSIRSLPLLGVKYADYYRRVKIQETVYELLTQQYELAKVEEAKETPSVKVLDPARIPERKSFPPRLVIILGGAFLALAGSVAWVLGSTQWEKADPQDPRKVLVQEVVATLKAQAPWASQNGHGLGAASHGVWNRLSRRPPNDSTPSV
jgi:capsule polysaccharide export protein KpsE/RkpR